jgi:UDP-glucose 4-epimerase
MTKRVAVLGASGFVGGAVCHELASAGWDVTPVRSPRLGGATVHSFSTGDRRNNHQRAVAVQSLAMAFSCMDAVVNAAGLARPASHDLDALTAANAVVPGVVTDACALADVARLVHISSVAVQGDLSPLDESSRYRAGSPYAQTKSLGEDAVRAAATNEVAGRTVVLRPTSVHGPRRAITRQLIHLARSPLASVIAPGRSPTPQVLVENVGAVAEYLCRSEVTPPPIVLQPWEGWTTAGFLQLLSGHRPHLIPAALGQSALSLSAALCRGGSRLAYRRRLEMLWCGQDQVEGWLKSVGFAPPYGRDHWDRLVRDAEGGGR